MATQHWGLLDEHEEAELHKTRLLNVEERPFKRLTKRLLAPGAFTNPTKLRMLAPDSSANGADDARAAAADVTALKEDITLDFAAFDSAIARLQFLADANAAERERYAADRLRILGTMEAVRAGNLGLRAQLEGARATLARRRRFDELADRITSNRMLRTRAEQRAGLDKLAAECEALRRESETYGATWRERRAQFERLVDEGVRLRALIRDEKEEVERREGMDDSDAEDGEAANSNNNNASNSNNNNTTTTNNSSSSGETPGKAGSATPHPDKEGGGGGGGGSATPRSHHRDSPAPGVAAAAPNGAEGLKPRSDAGRSFSRADSQAPSARSASQQPEQREGEGEGEDVEMGEPSTQQQPEQRLAVDTPMAEEDAQDEEARKAQEEEQEEGSRENEEAAPQIKVDAPAGGEDDKMDTT
ncbi:Tho complex subunit 7-domain-containing protein [Xylariaceae sp. FL0804]|nr:Tho complex subunit 7-domain-containing protein [Xylariaceae sp. FL0804]